MASLVELVEYCQNLLKPSQFSDYCPNGLQIDAGNPEVSSLAVGVTACQALIDTAADWGADLLLVHHGFFWKGEPSPLVGVKGRRMTTLIRRGISLMAYHLPLDAHSEVGNNRQLGERFGIADASPLPEGDGLLWYGTLLQPESAHRVASRIASALNREPLHIPGGRREIQRIGWCSGAAQSYIEQAAAAGLDGFISGEISEHTVHLARELDIHYYAAGHHATEQFGVQALGERLRDRFGVRYRFIDVPNPV